MQPPQTQFDILIIGAGIAGLSVAGELATDRKVGVLEREEHPGYHATGRSAAIYLPSYGPPSIQALTKASRDFFYTPPDNFTDEALLSPRQTMMLATSDQTEESESLLAAGMREITLQEALEKLPVLNTGRYDRFLLDADTMDIDVANLLAGHRKKLRRAGGTLLCDNEVTDLSHTTGTTNGTWTVSTPANTYTAPIVINAAGAWADEIARLAGIAPLGLQPMRRSAALIDVSDHHDSSNWPLTATADESFYFRPIGQKLMISPADKTVVEPHDAWADDLELARTAQLFEHTTGLEVTRVEHTWAGLRTFAPDGDPVVGYCPHQPGFFWLAGQGGYGIQTSPAMSRMAAALIDHQPVPDDILKCGLAPESISPQRFS